MICMRNYKALKEDMYDLHTAVNNMSTDSWRVLKEEDVHFFEDLAIVNNVSNTCVNGTYYWCAYKWPSIDSKEYYILVFHLSTEVFQLIKSPLSPSGDYG
ncbi:hypothetical protein PTKIN_Ptkin16aG0051900 [Pterospermum kingtungense]